MSAAAGAAGAAAAAESTAQAIRAMGTIVQVDPYDFLSILNRQEEPLVLQTTIWFFSTTYRYLTSYKGLAFYTNTNSPLPLPEHVEVMNASKIWVPGG